MFQFLSLGEAPAPTKKASKDEEDEEDEEEEDEEEEEVRVVHLHRRTKKVTLRIRNEINMKTVSGN